MAAHNPYRVLGVEQQASGGDIRRAYHALALRYHPDAAGESGERFVELHEAYELLSNPATRADYDRRHEEYAERRHRREFAPPLTVSSPFAVAGALLRSAVEMLDFDSFGFVHEGMRRQAPEPLHYELTLSPIEAERGGRFRFTIPVQRPDQLLFEERDIEVVVPAGVRDGARAGLTLDGRIVDVTVRME